MVLIGSQHSGDTLRLREFLGRNAFPYQSVDVDTDTGVQALLEQFQLTSADIPVMVARGKVYKNSRHPRSRAPAGNELRPSRKTRSTT